MKARLLTRSGSTCERCGDSHDALDLKMYSPEGDLIDGDDRVVLVCVLCLAWMEEAERLGLDPED